MSVWFFDPLLPLHYELIVMDFPAHIELRSEKGAKKSQMAHYKTMPDEEIVAMPVGQLASMDCLLLCWSTAPNLPLTMAAIAAWGFEYKSYMVWRKRTKNGKLAMGPGYRVRTTGELVIVATLGNPKQAFVPQTIFDGVVRGHSRKPEEFYDIAERIMPHARRADVFGRCSRPGWAVFGDEATKFDQVA